MAADVRPTPVRAALTVVFGLLLRDAQSALWSFAWPYYASPVVARRPRSAGVSLVLPYTIVSRILVAPDLWRRAGNAVEDIRFRPYFYIAIVRETLFTIGVLAGALMSRRPHAVRQI